MAARPPHARRRAVALVVLALTVVATSGLAEALARGLAPRLALAARSRVPVLHLHRPGLARASEVWIYRPDVPESADLPVVYFLHGNPGLPGDVFHAGLRELLDRYIAHRGRPFMLAAPDGNSSLHADTEWADSSDGSDEVESFLLHTVIPAVEAGHPRTAAHRAIAGFSMGGYGAMNIGLRHPELFGQIVSIAGYFSLDDPSQMFATADARLGNTPAANVAAAAAKRILLLEASGEMLPLIRGQGLAFKGPLQRAGAQVTWLRPPGAHDLAFVLAQLPTVARFLGRGFAAGA